jgi:hypothetical protein
MCVLSFAYIYVAVCRFCAVRCVIIICLSLLFSNYLCFLILFLHLFSCFVCFFCFVYSVFLYCFVYCFSFCIQLSPIFVQVYRPLPPGGNPPAVNEYHIISITHTATNPIYSQRITVRYNQLISTRNLLVY